MTAVIFQVGEDTVHGIQLAQGSISYRPLRRRANGDVVVTRKSNVASLRGKTELELPALASGNAWHIIVTMRNGDVIDGYYTVPNSGSVNFGDLTPIDPDTLEPDKEPDPAWWAMANSTVNGATVNDSGELILQRADGKTVNAGRVKGATGPVGPVGPVGPKGDTGVQGWQGPQGDTGPKGDKGDKGDTGPKGDKGDTGAKGATGATGATGPAGPKGDTGEQGPQGEPGKDAVTVEATGHWSIQGDDDGNMWVTYAGDVPPVFDVDTDGNIYLVTGE